MGIGFTLAVCAALVALSGILAVFLVKYGQKIAEQENKDEKLNQALEMHKTVSEVAVNQPISDDDVLAGLSKPD